MILTYLVCDDNQLGARKGKYKQARDGKNGWATRREKVRWTIALKGLGGGLLPREAVEKQTEGERERAGGEEEEGRDSEGKAEKRSRRGRLPSPTANPAVCPELGKGFKHHCLLQNYLWR